MAGSFIASSNQYYKASSAVVSAKPLTIGSWVKSTSASGQMIGGVGHDSHASRNSCLLHINSALKPEMFQWLSGSLEALTATTALSSGVWTFVGGVWPSSGDWRLCVGASQYTGTKTNTMPSVNYTSIGVEIDNVGSLVQPMNGQIAEYCIWDIALGTDDLASLADGMSPRLVAPGNIVMYVPMIRDVLDIAGGVTLTAYNSPTVADHPLTYMP